MRDRRLTYTAERAAKHLGAEFGRQITAHDLIGMLKCLGIQKENNVYDISGYEFNCLRDTLENWKKVVRG